MFLSNKRDNLNTIIIFNLLAFTYNLSLYKYFIISFLFYISIFLLLSYNSFKFIKYKIK